MKRSMDSTSSIIIIKLKADETGAFVKSVNHIVKKNYQAWKYAGSLPPITTYTKGKYGGRLIGLTLKFQSYDNNGKAIKGKFLKPFSVLVYHQCNRYN